MSNTPKTDAASFDITWRNGAYYVSIPNVDHATVVSAELARELECENQQLRDRIAALKIACDPFVRVSRLNAVLGPQDDEPMRAYLPAAWPTMGNLRKLTGLLG